MEAASSEFPAPQPQVERLEPLENLESAQVIELPLPQDSEVLRALGQQIKKEQAEQLIVRDVRETELAYWSHQVNYLRWAGEVTVRGFDNEIVTLAEAQERQRELEDELGIT